MSFYISATVAFGLSTIIEKSKNLGYIWFFTNMD